MAITLQRHVAISNATFATSQTFSSVQVDAGSNRGLIIGIATGQAAADAQPSSVQYGGVSATFLGEDFSGTVYGYTSFYYLANPAVGTANVTCNLSVSAPARLTAWVLDGVHQSTAPTWIEGTDGGTVTWSWTSTVNAFIAVVAARRGTLTWTAGGGLTESSNDYITTVDRVAAGYLIADSTSEAPTYTLSGGESGSNTIGSVQWLEAVGGGSAIAAISSGAHLRSLNR